MDFNVQTLSYLILNCAGREFILYSAGHKQCNQCLTHLKSDSSPRLRSLKLTNLLQNQVIANQLKRQSDDLLRLRGSLDTKTESENRLEKQVRESKRQYADLESKMTGEIMMARIRDAENTQRVAELTQKISGLECKVGHREGQFVVFRGSI